MSTLVDYSGEDEIYTTRSSYLDAHGPPCKRLRTGTPFTLRHHQANQQTTPPINLLPDECLFEILRHLPNQQRSVAACVSKHWLTLLSNIRRSELHPDSSDGTEADAALTRSLEGKRATDTRLSAIAVGTAHRGGLVKLTIRGASSTRGVTDAGLSAIARGCPSLKSLSLWNVPYVGDAGLIEIAQECPKLDRLDLSQCPSITNTGLTAIARCCPNLTRLSIESCPNIGNDGIQEIAHRCLKLESVSIKDCPLVGDQGIASLLSTSSSVLSKVKLQSLNISDFSLAVIGHYGKLITSLTLTGLRNVTERGFWVMGNANGLKSLTSLTVSSCFGVTDLSLEAIGKGCSSLKHMSLLNCCFVSDDGLIALSSSASSLESLHLEDGNKITLTGVTNALSNFTPRLKSLSLVKCLGVKDTPFEPTQNRCMSLQSLSVKNCPGFGSSSLATLGTMCPNLNQLDLSGLYGITDDGVLSLINRSQSGLVKLNLTGCINLTDESILAIARAHGETIKVLNLNNCRKITDASLLAISENCSLLNDLDISNCQITDLGIATLSSSPELNLQILSISGCSKISSKSIPFLIKLGQNLIGLNLRNCTSLRSKSIDMLVGNLWRCDILC